MITPPMATAAGPSCLDERPTGRNASSPVRLAIITVVSADLVELCRMFFRFYTVVEQVPPRDIYVVQANASASLRQCFEPLVPPLNVVPFQRRPPGRPLLLRASRGSTGHSGAGESFHHRGWMDMAMTLQRELLHHRAYTHTLIAELDEIVTT